MRQVLCALAAAAGLCLAASAASAQAARPDLGVKAQTAAANPVVNAQWRGRGGWGGPRFGGPRWSHGGWGYRPGWRPGVGLGVGLATGALVGSALAAPYYYDNGYYAAPPAYPAEAYPAQSGGDEAYCMQRYRSYDPASGTFLGYDGLRHPCP